MAKRTNMAKSIKQLEEDCDVANSEWKAACQYAREQLNDAQQRFDYICMRGTARKIGGRMKKTKLLNKLLYPGEFAGYYLSADKKVLLCRWNIHKITEPKLIASWSHSAWMAKVEKLEIRYTMPPMTTPSLNYFGKLAVTIEKSKEKARACLGMAQDYK